MGRGGPVNGHRWIQDLLGLDLVTIAPLSPAAATSAALLPESFPRDPADRLLYASAGDLGTTFVTRDEGIRAFAAGSRGVRVLW